LGEMETPGETTIVQASLTIHRKKTERTYNKAATRGGERSTESGSAGRLIIRTENSRRDQRGQKGSKRSVTRGPENDGETDNFHTKVSKMPMGAHGERRIKRKTVKKV